MDQTFTKSLLLLSSFWLFCSAAAPAQTAQGLVDKAKKMAGLAPAAAPNVAAGGSEFDKAVADLKVKMETARAKLTAANASTEERKKGMDENIAAIRTALAEVSDGGEIAGQLQQAIATSEGKAKEYKAKMNDPSKSGKSQESYQRLADKFKKEADGLYQSKMALNRQRNELESSLKVAEEQRDLFVDMLQAKQFEEANQAVKEMIATMGKVSDSINDLSRDIGSIPSSAPIAPQ